MWKLALALLAVSFAFGADGGDPWGKVKNLKTGSDLRIYKTGITEPITAKFADVTERKLLVIIKNTETAINKAEIDHVDYQPPAGKPVTTKTYTADGDSAGMSVSRSGGRDGWQTVYQRTPAR